RSPSPRRLLLRAGRRLRAPPAPCRPDRHPARAHRVHPGRHHGHGRPWPGPPGRRRPASPRKQAWLRRSPTPMRALKTLAVALGVTLGAIVVIPLAVLAGLFVWLKLTEEDDEEALELDEDV